MWSGFFKTKPKILAVSPHAAVEGGEVTLQCTGIDPWRWDRVQVMIDKQIARPSIITHSFVRITIPTKVERGMVSIMAGERRSNEAPIKIAHRIFADVTIPLSPVIDAQGCLYCLRQIPQTKQDQIIKLSADGRIDVVSTQICDPIGLILHRDGSLLVTSPDAAGAIYRILTTGETVMVAQGLGVPAGLAVTGRDEILVGDRQGTIFKVLRSGEVMKFATFPPALEYPRLELAPNGELFITAPDVAETRPILAIDTSGGVREVIDIFSKPTDLAFDRQGRLHVAARFQGVEGVYQVSDQHTVKLLVAGRDLRGIAFAPSGELIVAGYNDVYTLDSRDLR